WTGATVVPVNTRASREEVESLVSDAAPVLVLASEAHAGVVPCEPVDMAAADGPWTPAGVPGTHPFAVFFTSGTTGRPKGAVVSHASRIAGLLGCAACFEVRRGDRYLSATPMFTSAGISLVLLHVLMQGTVVVQPGRFDAPAALDAVEDHRIDRAYFVPTMSRMVLDVPGAVERLRASALRSLVNTGAGLDPRLASDLTDAGVAVADLYGSTESGAVAFTTAGDIARGVMAGRAFPGMTYRVVDAEGFDVPVGETGEIVCRGATLFDGYLDNPAAIEARYRHGWFVVGDLGTVDEAGRLRLMGRADDVIVSGGFNIDPFEVEKALLSCPSVGAAAVVGVPDEFWGEVVAAAVVPAPGCQLTVAEVGAAARERLAGYKRPRRIEVWESLPLSAAGKLLRREV